MRALDPLGTLLAETTYGYDGNGNRLTRTQTTGATTLTDRYAYNAANQLLEMNGEAFAHDANGNVTGTSVVTNFTYNTANQTVGATVRGGTPSEFTYRGDGQQERATAGPFANMLADGGLCVPLLPCIDEPSDEVVTIQFEESPLGVISESVNGVPTHYTRAPDGELLAMRAGSAANYYYIPDGLGSTVALTDAAGVPVATYEYDVFGQVTSLTGTIRNPWLFTGAYLDPTGLYKMGARYYDPALGRWTQQDPYYNPLDPKQWNRYVYVGNDPVNYVDPSGLSAGSVAGCMAYNMFGPGMFDFSNSAGAFIGGGAGIASAGLRALAYTAGETGAVRALAWAAGGPMIVAGAAIFYYGVYRSWKDCRS